MRDGRSEPLAGAWAVLHRFSSSGAAAVDSARTDRLGRYTLGAPAGDSTAGMGVAVRYQGVMYLEDVTARSGPETIRPIAVYDTSSTAQPILAQRQILVQSVLPDGSRAVVELLVLRNATGRTLVGADSARPSWQSRVMDGAIDVMAGEGDLNHEAVHAHGDTLEVVAPIVPGDLQLVLTYLLPASRDLRLTLDHHVDQLGLMVGDTLAEPRDGPVRSAGVVTFEEERYLKLEGRNVPAGTTIAVRLSPRPLAPSDFWWALVAGAALALGLGWFQWSRTRSRAQWSEAELMAAQIAAMDGDPARAADPGWPAERRALVATLAATLAREQRPS